ncbi:MAG: folate-binding protein YgfZ, partial [Gammaproteobacteria bacterium]|nr:folate-binding protein YgfZ [Gammaproteobacteria bacterium]
GQSTNDVRKVDAGHGQLAGYCSPKGRLLASFQLIQRDGDYFMLMERDIMEATLKRLRMFVLMSKVTLDDVSDEFCVAAVAGPTIEAKLDQAPAGDYEVTQVQGLSQMRLPGTPPRFLLLADADTLVTLWNQLDDVTPVGQGNWKLTDIRAAVPFIQAETVEAFVPQMVNMQAPAIEGVSFKKGCYPGQEVVARMQYLGKLKRRMYRGRVETDTAPKPGDSIFSEASSSGQGAGKVVDAQPSPLGGFELLAVIEIASAESGGLLVGSESGASLELSELPYELEKAS